MQTHVKLEDFLKISLNVMDQVSRSSAKKSYQIVCRILTKLLDWDYGEVWVNDAKSFDLIPTEFHYAKDEEMRIFAQAEKKEKLVYGEGFPGFAWQKKEPVWFKNVSEYASWQRKDQANIAGLHTCLAVPFIVSDYVDGVLVLFNRHHLREDKKLMGYMKTLSYYIGLNIVKKQLDALNRDNFCTEDQSVEIISKIFSTRDAYTTVHEKYVRCFALKLADKMQFNDQEKHDLAIASSLHDIGKIAIPMEILSKPSKLSSDEYALIKTHVQIGYDLIEDLSYSDEVKRMVLEHQERLDGSGYPNGKTRDQLYIGSQVLAVADVASAMLEHRPYRKAHEKEAVIEELKTYSDIKYNKEVVGFAIEIIKEEIDKCIKEKEDAQK